MTTTKYRAHPVWHETRAQIDGRAVLIAESASALLLRLKGTRQTLSLPYTAAYLRAASMAAGDAGIPNGPRSPRQRSRQVSRGMIGGVR